MSDSEMSDFSFAKTTDPDVVEVPNPHFSFAKLKKGRYACNGCNMKFYTKFLLNLHRVTRCSKLPYPCAICDLRFSSVMNHKSHQQIHAMPQKKKVAEEKIQETISKKEGPQKTPGRKYSNVRRNQLKTKSKVEDLDSGHPQKSNAGPQRSSNFVRNRRTPSKFLKEEALNFIHRKKMQVRSANLEAKNVKVEEVQKIQARSVRDDFETEKDLETNIDLLDSGTRESKKRTLKRESAARSDTRRISERNAQRDVKLFTCEECHLTFPGIGKLDRHLRVHSGKKAFQCKKCHLGFYWKSNYNRHVKTQCPVPENKYVCVTCGRDFNRRFSLLRHRQTRHPEEEAFLEDQHQEANTSTRSDFKPLDEKYERPSTQSYLKVAGERVKEEAYDEDTEVNTSSDERDPKSKMAYFVDQSEVKEESVDVSESEALKRRTRKKVKSVPRRYICDVCHIRFRWKCDLNRHRSTHNDIKAYPCDQCELGFNWKSNLTRHQRRIHCEGFAPHQCHMCGQNFVKAFHLARHVSTYCAKRPELLAQLQADGLVKTEEDIDENGVKSEQEVMVKQETVFSQKESVDSAEENLPDVNQNVNIVYLHVCQNEGSVYNSEKSCENIQPGASKDSKTDIPTHIVAEDGSCVIPKSEPGDNQEKNPKKEFVCTKCSRVFTRKTCYVQHERSHDRQPMQCGWCGRDFHRRSILEKHERIHTGEKPFECELCNSVFTQKSQLAQHVKTHSDEKPFVCEFCKCRFERKSLLERHRMIHTGERPYKCEYCDLTFNQRCSLVLHQRAHVGEKFYRCGKCNLRFTQKLSYVRHMDRVHFGDNAILPTKRNRMSNKVPDAHAYNTRYKAEKINEENIIDLQEDTTEDNCVLIESNPGKKMRKDYSRSVSKLERDSKFGVASESDVGCGPSKSDGIGSGIINSDVKASISLIGNNLGLQNPKEFGVRAVDQSHYPKFDVRNRAGDVFAKSLAPRKDINAYKSDSINEFIKSYKRKISAKDKMSLDAKNRSQNSTNGEMVNGSDHDVEMVQNKKSRVKHAKCRSRRCSEEIEISEGLAKFHIGTRDSVDIDDNGRRKDGQTSQNAITVESRSFTESSTDDNGRSYTKQGTYIFQDIITVESSTSNSINIKCNEDMEAQEEVNKDEEYGSINDKSETSDMVKSGEKLHSDNSPQKKSIWKVLEEFRFNKSHNTKQVPLEKNEASPNKENDSSTIKNTDCDQNTTGETQITKETTHVIRVHESFPVMNVDQQYVGSSEYQLDNKLNVHQIDRIEHQGSLNERVSEKESIVNHNSTQSVHGSPSNELIEVNFSEISVCKDKGEQGTISNSIRKITSEDCHVPVNQSATNINHENSALTDLSSKSILSIQEKGIESEDCNTGHNICAESECYSHHGNTFISRCSDYVEIIEHKKELDNQQSCSPISYSLQNNTTLTKLKVSGKDFENYVIRDEIYCIDEENIHNNLSNNNFHPVTDSLENNDGLNQDKNGIDLTQKHSTQNDLIINDALAQDNDDLINEIRIDKDNDCICEIHTDKKDCILGICTDNDNCINDIHTDNNDLVSGIPTNNNDCINKILTDIDCTSGIQTNNIKCIMETHTDNNDRINEIHTDLPSNCFGSITAKPLKTFSDMFKVKKSNNDFKETREREIDCVLEIHNMYNNPLKEIQSYKTNTCFQEVGSNQSPERELHFASKQNIVDRIAENHLVKQDINCATNHFSKMNTDRKMAQTNVISHANLNQGVRATLNEGPVQSGELVQFHNTQTFDRNGEDFQCQYTNSKPIKNESNLICDNQPMNEQPSWKEMCNDGSNHTFYNSTAIREPVPQSQFEFSTNNGHNGEEINTSYAGARIDQNHHGKPFILRVDSSSKQIANVPHMIHTDSGSPFQHGANWREPQLKLYPVHRNFVASNNEASTIANPEATYYQKNQWNENLKFQDGTEPDFHRPNEIPSNSLVQESSYDTDIDEESIRYAVQTVQAIIQAERPTQRESVPAQEIMRYETQSFQVPVQNDNIGYRVQGVFDGESASVQAPVQEVVRYHTQNFQVPVQNDNGGYRFQGICDGEPVHVQTPVQEVLRYQTQSFQVPVQNDGYGVHGHYGGREGFVHNYQNFQSPPPYKDNAQPGIVQYGTHNLENPFRYGYVDHNAVRNADFQRIHVPVCSESAIDQDGRIVQIPFQYKDSHFVKYPDHHSEGFVRQNLMSYREHDTIRYEDGFPCPKPILDLVPSPYSSSLEPFSYERSHSGINVQLAPYERVEVTETVYTNLELASYGKPSGDRTFVPYKEVFNDSGIVHKEQRNIIQYKDMYPYSTSENVFTHPIRPQIIHTTELKPRKASFHYEKSYTYPASSEINSLHDSVSQVGSHFENSVSYRNPYPNLQQNIPKDQNPIVISQHAKSRKRTPRRGRVRSETGAPRKTRRRKNEGLLEKSASIDQIRRQSASDQGHRGSCEQMNFAIDLVSPQKRAAIEQERRNASKRIEFDQDQKNQHKICIGSCDDLSKNISQYSMHSIKVSDKSFECDECSRIFSGKNDLMRHRFTEHEKNRLLSSFPN